METLVQAWFLLDLLRRRGGNGLISDRTPRYDVEISIQSLKGISGDKTCEWLQFSEKVK